MNRISPLVVVACALLLACLALMAASPARAETAGQPRSVTLAPAAAGPVVLSVAAGGRMLNLSIAELEALGMVRVRTSTFWPGDDGSYEGPLLADVLRHAGLDRVAAVRVAALDGFSQVLPREDWTKWPVVLATRRDGKPMSIRGKGPLRVIYPRDMDPVLQEPVYRLRWVWLVNAIEAAQ